MCSFFFRLLVLRCTRLFTKVPWPFTKLFIKLPPEIFNQQISMLVYFILQLVTGEIWIWFCHLDDNFLNTPYVRVIMHKLHDKMKYKICHFRPRCAPHPGRTKLSHPWGSNDTKSSLICLCMRCFDLLYFRKTICLELHKEYIWNH